MSHQRHHARQPSQGRKVLPPHARPNKPPPLTSRKSYNHGQGHGHQHSHSSGQAHLSPNKAAGPGWSKKVGASEEGVKAEEDEAIGMESFLQFCATCEKQIVTPQSSILYCSEACRRRDSRPASLQLIQQSINSPPPMANTASYFDAPVPEIVPQRSPTVLRPMSMTFSDLSLSDSDSHRLSADGSDSSQRRDSDATRYLEQFHSDYSAFHAPQRPTRPRMNRASTTATGGDSSTNLPSLIHSPSSSYGTVASNASYRQLPPRHNPFHTSFSTKSIELVIPYPNMTDASPTQLLKDASLKSSASTLTSFRVAEAGDISYEKRPTKSNTSSRRTSEEGRKTSTSLKQLFSHEAMKAPPKED